MRDTTMLKKDEFFTEEQRDALIMDLDKSKDIIKNLLKYLQVSHEPVYNTLVYRSPAQELRLAAESLEAKDAAIYKAREFIKHIPDGSAL
jgi:hypothetical protein